MTTPNPHDQPSQGSAPAWQQPQSWDQPPAPPPPPQWGPPPQAPGGYYPPPYYAPQRSTNGLAIASMVLGILWFYWVGSILALVFGYIAKGQIKERNEAGGGMATAGIILGWVGVGFLVIFIVFIVVAGLADSGSGFE